MAIQQTKQQSDIEKRLKLLRQQVYGKNSEHYENPVPSRGEGSEVRKARNPDTSENLAYRYSETPTSSGIPAHSESFRSDLAYLRHDLFKITSFATVAFAIQIVLYFLLRNNILRLNFF